MRRSNWIVAASIVAAVGALTCNDDGTSPRLPARSYFLGFSAIPPTPDTTLLRPTLTLSAQHSDAGLIQLGIPWAVLLSGIPPDSEVRLVRLPLADYYRNTGHKVVVALDVTDGLNRAQEAPELLAAGRSITEPAVQQLYREYVAAVDSILHPDYLSLAAETNLIRAAAAAPVYAAVVTMVNDAHAERVGAGSTTRFLVSVQVEVAWGGLAGPGGAFVGIATDRTDFPFLDALGLSSYPYLGGFAQPEDIPPDYYSRLTLGAPLPVLVLEGGWPSVPVGSVASTPQMQARYIHRQGELLDSTVAAGLFQITFTDFDLAAWPPAAAAGLLPFAHLGLVDSLLNPKPALAAWDSLDARPYHH
jgi:hypothetical protein